MVDLTDKAYRKDQAALRRVGAEVRARLEANPAVWQMPNDKAEIFAVADFLSAEECDKLIAMIEGVAKPSTVYDLDYSSGYRTSYSGDVDPRDPFVQKLARRVDDLMGIDPTFGETIQGQRYLPDQEFQQHHDFFYPHTSYWDFEMSRGGQRSFTAMAFLNEVEEGGTTEFVDLGISIEPKPGVLLIWNNASEDGLPNPGTFHAGRPVVKGAKYVFTKWYRTRKWS